MSPDFILGREQSDLKKKKNILKIFFIWKLRELVILVFLGKKIKPIINILYIWNTWQSGVEGTELSLDTCLAEKEIEIIFKNGDV